MQKTTPTLFTLLLAMLFTLACRADPLPPPPIDSITAGDTGEQMACEEMGCVYTPGSHPYGSNLWILPLCECPDTTTEMVDGTAEGGGADSSGGDSGSQCELHRYTCHMKQIQVYTTSATGSGGVHSTNPQAGTYGEGHTFGCLDVEVTFPATDLDNPMLADTCEAYCYMEDLNFDNVIGPAPSILYRATDVAPNPQCVWATVNTLPGYPSSLDAVCANQPTTTVTDNGPATNAECVVAAAKDACTLWDSTDSVASVPTVKNEHAISFDAEFRDLLLLGGGWADLYMCDPARLARSYVGATEIWSIEDASAGTLLYTMGLRNGDYDFAVGHNGTGSFMSLNSIPMLMDAFDAMLGDNTLYLTYKRPKVTGGYTSRKAYLAFI